MTCAQLRAAVQSLEMLAPRLLTGIYQCHYFQCFGASVVSLTLIPNTSHGVNVDFHVFSSIPDPLCI